MLQPLPKKHPPIGLRYFHLLGDSDKNQKLSLISRICLPSYCLSDSVCLSNAIDIHEEALWGNTWQEGSYPSYIPDFLAEDGCLEGVNFVVIGVASDESIRDGAKAVGRKLNGHWMYLW